jgi:hypothetical protein
MTHTQSQVSKDAAAEVASVKATLAAKGGTSNRPVQNVWIKQK